MISKRVRIELSLLLRNYNLLKVFFVWILRLRIARQFLNRSDTKQACATAHSTTYSIKEIVPCVSVILPTYNHGMFLEEAIQSVLVQEGIELNLIVVNDGSTDNTKEILSNYQDDPRIKIVHQENQGLPNALNTGLRLVKSEFITWTSADNKYLPDALLLLATALIENSSISLTYADYQIVNELGLPSLHSSYRVFDQDNRDSSTIHNCRHGSLFDYLPDNFIGPLFMFRRAQSHLVGTFSDLVGVEDYDYWLRLNTLGDVRHVYSEKPHYLYRIHANTLSNKSRALKTRRKLRAVVSKYW
jgi:glycosyltransferase involved in cell wall biosynthesis